MLLLFWTQSFSSSSKVLLCPLLSYSLSLIHPSPLFPISSVIFLPLHSMQSFFFTLCAIFLIYSFLLYVLLFLHLSSPMGFFQIFSLQLSFSSLSNPLLFLTLWFKLSNFLSSTCLLHCFKSVLLSLTSLFNLLFITLSSPLQFSWSPNFFLLSIQSHLF